MRALPFGEGFGAQLAGSESPSKSSVLGGFGAQLAGSETPSKSSILGGFWGPASWVGIPFEIVKRGFNMVLIGF